MDNSINSIDSLDSFVGADYSCEILKGNYVLVMNPLRLRIPLFV